MLKNSFHQVGKVLRSAGQKLDGIGASLEGKLSYTEHLVVSTRSVANGGKAPSIAADVFVAPNASLIGNVEVGNNSSVWYGATVRGDVNYVKIGSNSSIQDNAIVHVAKFSTDNPTVIGNNVTVGPSSIIHACTLEDDSVVGAGAQVLDGALVGKGAVVASGSVVKKGEKIPEGQLWSGVPATYLRDLSAEELNMIKESSVECSELAIAHAVECNKTFEELEKEEEHREIMDLLGPEGLAKPEPKGPKKKSGLFFNY